MAVSNTGMILWSDGKIEPSKYRHNLRNENGVQEKIHRIIARAFLPKTEEDIALGRDVIDHITHHPLDMNINDVRNLRWCTTMENNTFPEAKANKVGKYIKTPEWIEKMKLGMKGRIPWNKGSKGRQTAWNKGIHGAEYSEHFKNGFRNRSSSKEQ